MQHNRIDMNKAAPDAYKAVLALETYVQGSGLSRAEIHLVKLRASIVNGCAFCVDMHVKEARHDGLSEQWINLMSAWRESPVYSERERALLGFVDAVTLIAGNGVSDDAFSAIKSHFADDEIARILVAIGTINIWNRIAVTLRFQHPIDKQSRAA